MQELAQAIFDASPSVADDLIEVIDQWRALMLVQEGKDAELHPDNVVHDAVFRDRLERVDRLRKALTEIRYSSG
jgi:hypothetical protein